jgi:hypothetical protein
MPELPKPLQIPDDLYYVVKSMVDAWNEKRVISIQTKDLKLNPPDPDNEEHKIEIRILKKR